VALTKLTLLSCNITDDGVKAIADTLGGDAHDSSDGDSDGHVSSPSPQPHQQRSASIPVVVSSGAALTLLELSCNRSVTSIEPLTVFGRTMRVLSDGSEPNHPPKEPGLPLTFWKLRMHFPFVTLFNGHELPLT